MRRADEAGRRRQKGFRDPHGEARAAALSGRPLTLSGSNSGRSQGGEKSRPLGAAHRMQRRITTPWSVSLPGGLGSVTCHLVPTRRCLSEARELAGHAGLFASGKVFVDDALDRPPCPKALAALRNVSTAFVFLPAEHRFAQNFLTRVLTSDLIDRLYHAALLPSCGLAWPRMGCSARSLSPPERQALVYHGKR